MNIYLDASVLVALLVEELHTEAAEALVEEGRKLATSDWALAEATSALNRLGRIGRLTVDGVRHADAALDHWVTGNCLMMAFQPGDADQARILLQTSPFPLRAPDALHLTIAERTGSMLASFDGTLANAARARAVDVIP